MTESKGELDRSKAPKLVRYKDKMIKPSLMKVLHKICHHLNTDEVIWAVTGSLGLALQGMDVEIHDIDIQTDKSGAYEIERLFPRYVVRNIEFLSSDEIRSYFGELNIDGEKVEIMGNIQKRLPDGSWEDPINVVDKRLFIDYNGLPVPVISLEHEREAYRILGRIETAEQIRRYLAQHV